MKGWQLFAHSVRQVFGNFGAAVRISFAPMLIQTTILVAFGFFAMRNVAAPSVAFGVGFFSAMVVAFIATLWIAVAWHRFVLLNEAPQGLLPAFKGDRVMAYFLRTLAYLGISLVFGFIFGFVFSALGAMMRFESQSSAILFLAVVGLIIGVPALALSFRLSSGLPGAALGAEGDFTVGWRATNGATGDIIVMTIIVVAVSLVLQFIGGFAFSRLAIFAAVWDILLSWVSTMVGVSILTTLYGHYVEKRPLV